MMLLSVEDACFERALTNGQLLLRCLERLPEALSILDSKLECTCITMDYATAHMPRDLLGMSTLLGLLSTRGFLHPAMQGLALEHAERQDPKVGLIAALSQRPLPEPGWTGSDKHIRHAATLKSTRYFTQVILQWHLQPITVRFCCTLAHVLLPLRHHCQTSCYLSTMSNIMQLRSHQSFKCYHLYRASS